MNLNFYRLAKGNEKDVKDVKDGDMRNYCKTIQHNNGFS